MQIEVELYEFDDEEIIKYATSNHLVETLDMSEDDVLLEEVKKRGYTFIPNEYYPNNDIISQDLIGRFAKGFGKIDKNELEQFLTKFGV